MFLSACRRAVFAPCGLKNLHRLVKFQRRSRRERKKPSIDRAIRRSGLNQKSVLNKWRHRMELSHTRHNSDTRAGSGIYVFRREPAAVGPGSLSGISGRDGPRTLWLGGGGNSKIYRPKINAYRQKIFFDTQKIYMMRILPKR